MNISEHVNRWRTFTNTNLLPSICKVRTPKPITEVDEMGVPVRGDVVYRTYADSEDIPCRIDPSRAFRPEYTPLQAIVADEYEVHFPVGFLPQHADIIETADGRLMRIRKITEADTFDVTTYVLASYLSLTEVNA
jgi:hypothetical protein